MTKTFLNAFFSIVYVYFLTDLHDLGLVFRIVLNTATRTRVIRTRIPPPTPLYAIVRGRIRKK